MKKSSMYEVSNHTVSVAFLFTKTIISFIDCHIKISFLCAFFFFYKYSCVPSKIINCIYDIVGHGHASRQMRKCTTIWSNLEVKLSKG